MAKALGVEVEEPERDWKAWLPVVLPVVYVLLMLIMIWSRYELGKTVEARLDSLEKSTESRLVSLGNAVNTRTSVDAIRLKILILEGRIKPALAREIAKSVYKEAELFHIDPNFVLAMIKVESNFDPAAVSTVGAEGLLQVMPEWKEQLGITEDLHDIGTGIHYGIQIYQFYDKMYKEVDVSLTAYNRGDGKVFSDLMKGRNPRNGYAKKVLKVYKALQAIDK